MVKRRSLAEFGKRLGKQTLDEIAGIVNPDNTFNPQVLSSFVFLDTTVSCCRSTVSSVSV